uniref:WAP domain-containing protein n=1 Tax=Pseudonaja textilis TaxID=8673 RepID=A0A670ZLW5_PSETE
MGHLGGPRTLSRSSPSSGGIWVAAVERGGGEMPTIPGKGAPSPGGTHGSTSLPEAAEKAGVCPQAELERPDGNCTEECQSDARCEGNQKCCRTGCGTSCRIPDEKAGSCPDVDMPIPPLGICRTTCQSDSNCPNIKKCCKNGCGFMSCSTPKA